DIEEHSAAGREKIVRKRVPKGETSERKERAAVAPFLLLSAFLVFLRFSPLMNYASHMNSRN
ncbi:MAG: hypothetical protein IJX54_03780, partial [Oscillospiraceae bacterium]|nr:hypothetical protein [Oscillospiraceae bacterium]